PYKFSRPRHNRAPEKSSDFLGKGAAAEGMSFRVYTEANDMQLVATRRLCTETKKAAYPITE
uniref:hypothetical protein n=1 Tax=uncultured Dysosmobacter sp. TaxID=2591384 RepID=UPI002605CEF4